MYGWGNSRISLLESATNFLKVFNISAMMASQGGRVQREQSNMRLVLNPANMAKERFSRAAILETQYLIEIPRAKIQEKQSGRCSFLEINRLRLQYKDSRLWLVKTSRPDASFATMAPQKFRQHTGDSKEQEHLRPTNANGQLHSQLQSQLQS